MPLGSEKIRMLSLSPIPLYTVYVDIQAMTVKKIFLRILPNKIQNTTNSEYIYRKTVDYISRMAFDKNDLEGFQ